MLKASVCMAQRPTMGTPRRQRTQRGLEINLEDEKVQRNPVDELAPKKLTLQLDTPIFSATDAPSIFLASECLFTFKMLSLVLLSGNHLLRFLLQARSSNLRGEWKRRFFILDSLREHLHDHINEEIVSGTISNKEEAIIYLTWTYLYRKLVVNPAYYGLEDTETYTLNSYLSRLVETTFEDLEDSGCIKVDDHSVKYLILGKIASQYYVSYLTVSMFGSNIGLNTSLEAFLHILLGAAEFDELPVHHNEDNCFVERCHMQLISTTLMTHMLRQIYSFSLGGMMEDKLC